MAEKKTNTKPRAPRTQAPQIVESPSVKEKGIVIAVRPAFALVKKADGSAIKIGGLSAKIGDEIEI